MTLSQIGVIPHVCVKGTSAYEGDSAVSTLPLLFSVYCSI